jgi:hypothetical protein
MSRTINEIIVEANEAQKRIGELYTVVNNAVSAEADLSGLTSVSKTAEFNLWKYVWAAMAYIQEQLWGERQAEIQTIVSEGIPGTDLWLQKELLKFQYGDSLAFDNNTAKYSYAVIDATKKIIKRCAVISSGGVTLIKVAKEDGTGNPIALTVTELTAFTSYVRQIQWAGANISNPTTANSDKLNAPMTVYYNGTVALADLKPLVQAAFNDYLKALAFNGEYKITAQQDAVQNLANVNDVVMGMVQAKADGAAYANVNRIYIPVAGYIERDATIDFDTMITYVSQ